MSGPNYNGWYGPINNSYKCKHCDEPAVYGVIDTDHEHPRKVMWLCTTHNQARAADHILSREKNVTTPL